MALDTYTNLKTAIQTWMARADLAADVDDMIDMFEAYCNRNLRVPSMEQEAISPAQEFMALPSDFLQMRDIQYQASPVVQLSYVTPTQMDQLNPSSVGTPRYYTIVGDQLRISAPPPSTDISVRIDYWQKIPALSNSQSSNWLLAGYPDAYLYGALMHGNIRISNPAMASAITGPFQQAIAEINQQGRNANLASSLVMRPM